MDRWHLVRLADEMVTEVRQRVNRQLHQRRGLATDPVWSHRRMLPTAGNRLSRKQLRRLDWVLTTDDPTGERGAAWGCWNCFASCSTSTTRAASGPHSGASISPCADASVPETSRLATTIETWWPATLVALTNHVTNARTEGFNRSIKQVKRAGCGFTNMDNYRRRIMAHIAVNRP